MEYASIKTISIISMARRILKTISTPKKYESGMYEEKLIPKAPFFFRNINKMLPKKINTSEVLISLKLFVLSIFLNNESKSFSEIL
jgi:hypothetical protein